MVNMVVAEWLTWLSQSATGIVDRADTPYTADTAQLAVPPLSQGLEMFVTERVCQGLLEK